MKFKVGDFITKIGRKYPSTVCVIGVHGNNYIVVGDGGGYLESYEIEILETDENNELDFNPME